jgi:acetylornithine deacetylase/succinyl-diaminopimelate desuccinylase-like protein
MHERHDALCAAAEAVLLVEDLARKVASTVATVGTVAVEPNSLTAVPGRVKLGLDVRGTDPDEAEDLISRVMERSREISGGRGVDLFVHRLSSSAPKVLDEGMVKLAEEVARREGIPAIRCVSYAGHDAQHLAERVPAALLFAASSNGVSHAPEEAIDQEDLRSAYRMVTALLPELERNHGGG